MDLSGQDNIALFGALGTRVVTGWMVACVVIGQLLWRRRVADSRVTPSRFSVRWREPKENPTLVILLCVALLSLWQASLTALSVDEASHIEPHFWSRWYGAWESRSSPPLFRALIHLPVLGQHRILMRLPALTAALGALVLLYHMLRRRSSPAVAQWLLAAVAGSSLLLGYAVEQKSCTLWLLLLLACHRCLSSALRGRGQMWVWFSLFGALAMLTEYLSVAWLAGYLVWAWWRSREDVPNIALALLPGALAVAPMIVPILSLVEPVSEGSGARLFIPGLVVSLSAALVPSGVVGAAALFLLRPVDYVRGSHQADGSLPWIIVAGIIGVFIVAISGVVEARLLMPVLPMAGLAAAGRMPKSMRDWGRSDRAILAAVMMLSLAAGLARVGSVAVATAINPVARAIETLSTEEPPSLRVVQPQRMLHVALYEVSGRRDLLHGVTGDKLLRWIVEVDGVRWGALRKRPTLVLYDQIAAKYGEFELWSLAGRHEAEPVVSVESWTHGVCTQTVRVGNPERTVPGPWVHVWRCRAREPVEAASD